MLGVPVGEVIVGIYLGLLAGIFPAFIAFSLAFSFKYFTDVTIPGLGVVALSGALAGVSGGLMGLIDPRIAESWIGITAVVVILMASLWAHSIGDKLGAQTPRRLTLATIRDNKLTADLVERVDSYGQFRVRPTGEIREIEGYPALSTELRQKIADASWKFPAGLTLTDLEHRLETQLLDEFDLADVEVTVDRRGRARIAAAATPAGLSRRVPAGKRAVTIQTLLPTGIARGDVVEIRLPEGTVSGPVLSARTTTSKASPPSEESTDSGADETTDVEDDETPQAPTTTGGTGRVTVAVSPGEALRILATEFAPITVHAQGSQREYEAVALLRADGNQFRKLTLRADSPLVGEPIGAARVRDTYGVAILTIRRGREQFIAPDGSTRLAADDELIVVGRRRAIRSFREVAT